MKQIITVRAIVKQDNRILLLRRTTGNAQFLGLYELPGGKVDFGEDPKAALNRELLEEIGCGPETVQLLDVHSNLDASADKQYVSLIFAASIKGGTHIELSSEHDRYVWKSLSDIQLNTLTDFTKVELGLGVGADISDEVAVNEQNIDVEKSTKSKHVIIYTDGGSRGNPGPSASGFVIKDSLERTLFEGGKYLGITTNNQAEYLAVKIAFERALAMGAQYVQLRLDSQLVANQLTGVYQIKNRDLWPIHAAIKELMAKFKECKITHVRREFNKEADAMVNKVLDEQVA